MSVSVSHNRATSNIITEATTRDTTAVTSTSHCHYLKRGQSKQLLSLQLQPQRSLSK